MRTRRARGLPVTAALLAAGAAALAAGCSDDGGVRAIETTRVVEPDRPVAEIGTAERFGFTGTPAARAPAAAELQWDVPDGWTELPPSPPRLGSFTAPGGLDVSITSLPGSGGGMAANVNRWRTQMGLDPAADAEIDGLPRQPMLGGSAVRVDVTGAFAGMGDTVVVEQARLVGLILEQGARTVFVKLTGPADAVEAQLAGLDRLAASLRAGAGGGTSGLAGVPGAAGALPAGHPDIGMVPGGGTPGGASGGFDPDGLTWTVPEGWERGADKPFRVVSFSPRGAPEVDCYVVVLLGSGGGLVDNVNRWRTQMEQPPLGEDEVAALPTIEVLGRDSPLIEIEGAGAAAGSRLLGLVSLLPTHGVFVKLTGPDAAVAAQRDAFAAFCRSLGS